MTKSLLTLSLNSSELVGYFFTFNSSNAILYKFKKIGDIMFNIGIESSRIVQIDKYINIDGTASLEKTLYP